MPNPLDKIRRVCYNYPMKETKNRKFANGVVHALVTEDNYPLEVTDTFLPYYTKDAVCDNQNKLKDYYLADRSERWMIGVSCMSGCPVGCKFCATGRLKKWRNLTGQEIFSQIAQKTFQENNAEIQEKC